MSHVFEFAAHNAPLMIIQFYNNQQQNTFSKPTTAIIKMNIAFSVLNLLDLILELFLTQLLSPDHEFSILNKSKIGIVEDESSSSLNTDSSEEERVEVKEVIPFDKQF